MTGLLSNRVRMAAETDSNVTSVICNVLSVSVVSLCIIMKMPQISLILKQKNGRGMSLNGLILNVIAFSVLLTYQCGKGYPLTTYLEFCFLVPQDILLLVLVLKYTGKLTAKVIPLFVIYFAVAYMMAFRLVPDIIFNSSISLPLPLAMSSKLLQIMMLVRTKDSGAVSAATWGMATYTAGCRCLTTLVQTGDVAVLTTYAVNTCLNATMTTLCILYRPKKKAE